MTIPRKASLQVWFPACVLVLTSLPFLTGGFEPAAPGTASPVESAQADAPAAPAEFVWLPSGTRFEDDRPPQGWSHVVFKSTPNLASGDLQTLSKEAFATAKRIRLTILADVERPAGVGPHRLARVGVGLAAPRPPKEGTAGAGDVIVTASDVGSESGDWSTKERIILAAGSRELGKATLAAATPTFALLKTPTTYLVGREHQTLDVCYAILVDPESGALRLFACKPGSAGEPAIVRELAAPAIVDGPLHVKARTLAGIPIAWSFAMADLPPGSDCEIPDDLLRVLSGEAADGGLADARAIEDAFRTLADRPSLARAPGSVQRD